MIPIQLELRNWGGDSRDRGRSSRCSRRRSHSGWRNDLDVGFTTLHIRRLDLHRALIVFPNPNAEFTLIGEAWAPPAPSLRMYLCLPSSLLFLLLCLLLHETSSSTLVTTA